MGSSPCGRYSGDSVSGFMLSVCAVCEEEASEGTTNHMYPNISGNLHNFFHVSLTDYKIYKIPLCIHYTLLMGTCNVKCKLWVN